MPWQNSDLRRNHLCREPNPPKKRLCSWSNIATKIMQAENTASYLTASHFRALAAHCRSHSLPIVNPEILARIERRAAEWAERASALEAHEMGIAAE
jgi:hypothetical protein